MEAIMLGGNQHDFLLFVASEELRLTRKRFF